jgi:rhamnosyltransferase
LDPCGIFSEVSLFKLAASKPSAMVSIIIRTYNEERYLRELFEWIDRQKVSHEIQTVIVDSGSSDETLEIAKARADKIVHIKKDDFSFGRSLNMGCEVSDGDVFVFLSGHCIPYDEYWLRELIAPFERPSVGMSFGRQIGNHTTKFSEKKVFEKYYPPHPNEERIAFFANNASSAVLPECWRTYRFDEAIPGLEDMHFAKQLIRNGYKIEYCPGSIVYHLHHESWGRIKTRYEREAIALREIMPGIHLHYHNALRYAIAAVFSDFVSAFKERLLFRKFIEIVLYRFLHYYGSSKGNHRHRRLSNKDRINYFYPK